MNLEGAFGLAIILLIAIRATPRTAPGGSPDSDIALKPLRGIDLKDALAWLAICAATLALFWRAAHFGFLSDDFVLIAHARYFDMRSSLTTGGGDGFYRPLVYGIIWWTRGWAGVDPVLWRAAGLAVHAANAIFLYLVVWALGYSRFAAGFAAALFAVHATRPEVAIWIAGRFDLFATMFVLIALFCFLRAWDVPQPSRALLYRALAVVSMTLGLLSKESAYAFPLMVLVLIAARARISLARGVAHASACSGELQFAVTAQELHTHARLPAEAGSGTLKRAPRFRELARDLAQALPVFCVAALLFAYRWHLLGGIGGYRNSGGKPEIVTLGFIEIFKALALRLWAILFMPVNWTIRPGLLLTAAMAMYLAALLWLAITRVGRHAFMLPLALLLAAAIPVVPVLLIGPDLEKSRHLYLPSSVFALLLAVAIDASKQKWIMAAAILAFQAMALEHNLGAWESAAAKAESACALVANASQGDGHIAVAGLPRTLNGVYFFANGFPECVELRNPNRPAVTILGDAARPIDRSRFPVVFEWDSQADELRLQP